MLPYKSSQRFAEIKDLAARTLESVATALGHTHPVFTHADLHKSNVIVRQDSIPCIIDYKMARFYATYHEYLVAALLDDELDFLNKFFEEH
jgi:predicted unusual protein kinase regulating ubiquinone biosynthesis (AarF/ABC1/UbiB family)